jgi:3-hydroxyisobutyrate dehydrogenase-like beta-hydroxyacid dehydrogenase
VPALVNEFADRAAPAPDVASASRGWFQQAAKAGAGDLDYSAVLATIAGDGTPSPA